MAPSRAPRLKVGSADEEAAPLERKARRLVRGERSREASPASCRSHDDETWLRTSASAVFCALPA